jgi:hypothetical protein
VHLNKRLSLTVGYDEVDVRNTVKTAGGQWDGRQKVWKLAYKQVMVLGLIDQVVSRGNDKEVG